MKKHTDTTVTINKGKSKSKNISESSFAWAHMTIKDIENLPSDYISHKKSLYKEIKNILPEHRTFKNTVLGMEHSDIKTVCHIDGGNTHHSFADHMHEMHLLSNVSSSHDLRVAAQNCEVAVHKGLIDIEFDRGLYTALLEYYHGNYEEEKQGKYIDEHGVKYQKLDAADIRLFEHMLRDYKRMGFDLDDMKFRELKKLLKELTNISSKFRVNINNYNDYILVNDYQLDGCSDRYVESLEQIKDKDNNTLYKIKLDYPESGPYMGDAKCREKRKELADKLAMKGGKVNLKVLEKMVTLRIKISKLLGYNNYVDYKVEDRMAKNSANVLTFVNDLIAGLAPKAKDDLKHLRDFAKSSLGIKKLEYYDYGYAMKELGKMLYSLDNETLRGYFPTDHVLDTMFNMFGKLFGFNVKERNDVDLWHKDAKVYDVISTIDGDKKNKIIANLILDLYPRPNKYGHAAAFDTKYSDTKVVTLLCNFPRPTGNTPSLMSLGEVETIFHEFGHAMHFMLSDTKYKSHNGFHVAWDFVEAPSQIMEEWVMDARVLRILGKHYKTGKRLDDNTIQNIIESKKLMRSYGYMRQLIQTKLDLDIHLGRAGNDYKGYYAKLMKKYFGIEISSKSLFPAGFGHMDGYDSGYYSYLWAEVYAADFFSKFKKDVFSTAVGARYRKEILSVGSSRDEVVSAQRFLGRISTAKAFLDSISK